MSEPLSHHRTGDAEPGETPPAARRSRQPPTRRVTAAVVCGFLLLDLGGGDGALSDPSRALVCGALIAEASLIAFWAVFGPGNLVVRLPAAFLAAMTMCYVLVLGNSSVVFSVCRADIALCGSLLAVAAIAQTPFWIAKRVFRWRLIQGADDPGQPPSGPWQFHIRHLLIATFLVAVALSPLRWLLGRGSMVVFHSGDLQAVPMAAVFAAGAVCNLFVAVPCVWGALARTVHTSPPLALAHLVYCGLLTALELLLIPAISGASWSGVPEAFAFLLTMNISQAATVFVTLWIYREIGFRFVRSPRAGAGLPDAPVDGRPPGR
ncbi:MAG: hypothetical protein ACLQLG_00175 [Thermoguttaceae bacterium]